LVVGAPTDLVVPVEASREALPEPLAASLVTVRASVFFDADGTVLVVAL